MGTDPRVAESLNRLGRPPRRVKPFNAADKVDSNLSFLHFLCVDFMTDSSMQTSQTSELISNPVIFASGTMPDVFTIDVEDWFHILEVEGTPDLDSWDILPSRLESNFRFLLDLLAAHNVTASCFTLGWVAKRFPKLLREAGKLGHDIASHGFGHQLVDSLSRLQFRDDIRAAKAAIEDAIGSPVYGYRAPGFSITRKTPWAFEEIVEAGYIYDSSVFPGFHGHGGIPQSPRYAHVLRTSSGNLIEFPITVADTPIGPHCCFGGGYLRLYPLWLILRMTKRVHSDGRGVIWYIHPREIDPAHPKLTMSFKRRFKSYVNLRQTVGKLQAILRNGEFSTFARLASNLPDKTLANSRFS
jgi:polysaccharide deacetylase family protein (PEP-CTERM system associated)